MALELRARARITALDEIRDAFDLSETELGSLFGITRQAVSHWRARGIPPHRSADLDRVAELAEYLGREFLADRLPQIVRTPSRDKNDGLGGRTFLDVLRADGVMPIYRHLERLFAYGGG
jgi:transcriptional regulator with XRE-family HTH domain